MVTNKYKKMRQELGLSQRALAKKLGVAQGTISHWESGKCTPCARTLKKMNKLIGV